MRVATFLRLAAYWYLGYAMTHGIVACLNLRAEELPNKVTGTILDTAGKPLADVRVELLRAKTGQEDFDLEPEVPGFDARVLGEATTDPMGHFLIRPAASDPTEGPLLLGVHHRDYVFVRKEVADPSGMTIRLKPDEIVARAWAIRDASDPEAAERLAVALLQGDENKAFTHWHLSSIYPHIGSIRATLLTVATGGKHEQPVKEGWSSPGHRARMLLTYWGDERDEALQRRWWREREPRSRHHWKFDNEFHPAVEPADDLQQAVAKWRKSIGLEKSGFVDVHADDEGRALVQMIDIAEPHGPFYMTHAIFLKRDNQWHVLFHRRW